MCTCVDVCMHVYMRGYEEVVGGGGGDMCGVRCVYNYKCFYFLLVYTVFLLHSTSAALDMYLSPCLCPPWWVVLSRFSEFIALLCGTPSRGHS